MKLSVSFFAFASVWHSVHGQEQSTFLRGRGAEVEAAVEDEGAFFWQHGELGVCQWSKSIFSPSTNTDLTHTTPKPNYNHR